VVKVQRAHKMWHVPRSGNHLCPRCKSAQAAITKEEGE